jgi:hypothetical protein
MYLFQVFVKSEIKLPCGMSIPLFLIFNVLFLNLGGVLWMFAFFSNCL